jgi:UDP-N-acetylmuramoylalanine--D-glutamate ligase
LSPGVEDDSPPVRWAEELGIPLIGEMELGFRLCRGRIIAITGTNGKSTVTALTGAILKGAGLKTVVCGNIGNALCGEIDRITERHWVVLEVSSFQLERIDRFKPHISIILNVTDDHQDRYPDFRRYFNEKLKIFKNQDRRDCLILNYDASGLKGLKERSKAKVLFYSKYQRTNGAYTQDGRIVCVANGAEEEICDISDVKLKGLHNLENVLASVLAATLAGADAQAIKSAVRSFKGLEHRFEPVDVIGDVEFVDDSKGTTVDSTMRALESSAKAVVLIAGGRDKRSDYTVIRDMVKKKVRHLVLIGEAKDRIASSLGGIVPISEAETMDEAVQISFRLASPGETVLLSPMCSSFDMFKDYKERGRAFKEAVAMLSKKEKVKR